MGLSGIAEVFSKIAILDDYYFSFISAWQNGDAQLYHEFFEFMI